MVRLDGIDDTDRRILTILQENARISTAELARQVGMAASAVYERIRKLEQQGVILGYEARLNPRALDLETTAFIFVRVDEPPGDLTAGAMLGEIAGVQEVHHIAGEDCYIVKVRTESTESLGRLLRERVRRVAPVRSTRTTIVLGTVKESSRLPLQADGHDG